MLCGSLCVSYVIKKIVKKVINIDPNMLWSTDLALCLMNVLDNKIEVRCFNSSLYNDYKKMKNLSFSGFSSIKKYLDSNGKILETKLSINNLKKELDVSKYLIICVESKILNNDDNMYGGHFVIIEKDNKKIKMINPLRKNFEEREIDYQYIIKLCINFGAWRILIRR